MKSLLINLRESIVLNITRLTTYRFTQVILGSWLITLGAYIEIPFYPVPMNLQTFSIALISTLVPIQVSTSSIAIYLSYAAIGLPVLSGGGQGIVRLLGPTAGYIIGFFFLSGIVSLRMQRYATDNILKRFSYITVGSCIQMLLGITYLSYLFGWEIGIKSGLLPFIISEPIKMAGAAYISVLVSKKFSE